jgi:ABC-type glycerol-3-phosphate transport system substrate-binding protein
MKGAKKMKQGNLLKMLSAVLLCAVLLPACGGKEAAAPAAEGYDPGVLEFWGFYDLTDTQDRRAVMMKQAIDSFQAISGVKVNYEQVAWDQMSNKVALLGQSGGDMPDVVQTATENVTGWVNAGVLLDIMPYVKNQHWYDDLTDFEKELYEQDGERYAVGLFISGGNWYFDLTKFPGELPRTNEDWEQEFPRLKAQGDYGFTAFMGRGSGGAAIIQGYGPMFYSAGGRLYDDEGKPDWVRDENIKVIQWLKEHYEKGHIAPATFTGDWSATEVPFEERKAGAVRGGSWSFLYMRGLEERYDAGEVKIGPPPAFGDQGYVFINSEAMAVPKGAKNVDNAIKFINLFLSPQFLAPWANAQFGIPVISTALDSPIFDHQFYKDTADNIFSNGIVFERSPYLNECNDALAAKLQELIITPGMDIRGELQNLQDELIKRYW